jgi:hypothetical protein
MQGNELESLAISTVHVRKLNFTDVHGILQDSIKYRLQIAGRTADYLEDF